MNIGVFGGTFDPLHNNHLYTAEHAARVLGLDVVHFVVCNPYLGKTSGTSLRTRWEITQEAVFFHKCDHLFFGRTVSVGDIVWELFRDHDGMKPWFDKPTYTADVVQYFKVLYPCETDRIYVLLGSDQFNQFARWDRNREIAGERVKLVDLERGAYSPDTSSSWYSSFIHIPLPPMTDISSTMIRTAFVQGRLDDYAFDLPESVLKAIRENRFEWEVS